jgi:hypothetical protein
MDASSIALRWRRGALGCVEIERQVHPAAASREPAALEEAERMRIVGLRLAREAGAALAARLAGDGLQQRGADSSSTVLGKHVDLDPRPPGALRLAIARQHRRADRRTVEVCEQVHVLPLLGADQRLRRRILGVVGADLVADGDPTLELVHPGHRPDLDHSGGPSRMTNRRPRSKPSLV